MSVNEFPPLPGFAKGDWGQVSDMISFDGPFIIPGGGGPDKYTLETFVIGAAKMLYGDRAEEVIEHWRKESGNELR